MKDEKTKKTLLPKKMSSGDVSANRAEFTPGEFKVNSVSSAETIEKNTVGDKAAGDVLSPARDLAPLLEKNFSVNEKKAAARLEHPIFRELAEPKLPVLKKENRARLQMQSPTRLHFYWSVKGDSFETLHRIFGANAKNYRLVVKLINQNTKREEISPIENEGSWWFDVDADSRHQAEIGFYAAGRSFVRLMFSNSVETPRRSPSPRNAGDRDWTVSADSFAQILDSSGYTHDAFEVALAGDDRELAESSTRAAFAGFFGGAEKDFAPRDSSEMRFALLALASGYALEDLREHVSPTLFAKLREMKENLSREKALAALQENFGVFTDENYETESVSPSVFGASLINFPRRSERIFSRKNLPKFAPVSSFS